MTLRPQALHLSTVTPVYQGEKYLRELVAQILSLKTELEADGCPVQLSEAIFVDDGSIDRSSDVLAELQAAYPWVKVIQLSRNFGQHPATIAGILHSGGDWVATLDEDLQHPPEKLPQLLTQAISNSLDVVYAHPEGAVHGSPMRDTLSRLYKRMLSQLSGNAHVRQFNSFRMVRGSVARAAAALCGHETYLDVSLCWFTNRIGSVSLPLRDIRYLAEKKSGYNFWSLLRHARRLLISSQVKALRLGTVIGVLALLVSLVMIVWIIVSKIAYPEAVEVRGWATTVVLILFFGGLTSFLHGIALEYISILVYQTQGKPTFLVIDRGQDRLYQDWLLQQGRA